MYLRALAMSNIILSQIICLFVLIWLKVIFYALHVEHIYKFTQVVLELKKNMKKSILMIYFILRIQKELYLYFMHFTNIFKQITQILHS